MKPIPLYEDKYFINWDGSVYSKERIAKDGRFIPGRWLKPSPDKDGYLKVMLYSGGRGSGKTFKIHRLVASSFVTQEDISKCFVNHKDGNKTNNHYLNLEWVSAKENTCHAWNLGLCSPYDRAKNYYREGIIQSNKNRKKSGI